MFRPSPRSVSSSAPKNRWCQLKNRYASLSQPEEYELLADYAFARDQLRVLIESNPLSIHLLERVTNEECLPSGEITGVFKVMDGAIQKDARLEVEAYSQHRKKLLELRDEFARVNLPNRKAAEGEKRRSPKRVQNSIAKAMAKVELPHDAILSMAYSFVDLVKELEHFELQLSMGTTNVDSVQILESKIGVSADYLKTSAQDVGVQLAEIKRVSERIIEHCLPMVIRISGNYHRHDFQLDDLIQEGLLGVLISLNRFDLERGVRFKTYANYWVRQSVGRAVLDRGRKIRVPRHAMAMYSRVMKTRNYLQENSEDDEVTAEDISDALKIPLQSVNGALNLVQQPLSLDGEMVGGGGSMADFLKDDDAFSPEEETMFHMLSDELKTVLEKLPEREEKILRMRYGIGAKKQYTLRELGEIMGISRERVRQLEQQALGRIRSSQSIGQLREFLGPMAAGQGDESSDMMDASAD